MEFLVSQTQDHLSYELPNGMRIVYPNTRVGEFLRAIYLDLFHHKKNISRVLQGLAGADVRKALDMFQAILISGHLSEAAITSQTQGAGSITIPEYTVLKILMRTEYRFFSDESGFVKNIFGFEQTWENPNNFLIVELLYYLTSNRRVRGQIGLEGYFSIEHLADVMQLQGFLRSDVLSASNYLLKAQLVEADHMNSDRVLYDDCLRVSSAGFIHLRILSERLEYLYGILPVTPVFGHDVANAIANTISLENQRGSVGGYQMLGCIKQFHKYLEVEAARLRRNFSDFGSEHSGTTYVLKQIQGAISHFENPAVVSQLPNLLDT